MPKMEQIKPGVMPNPAEGLLENKAMLGDVLNGGGTNTETKDSISLKLKNNKKMLPGVGFQKPSKEAKKASSSLKKMKKKVKK